jgi:hypothetical protein
VLVSQNITENEIFFNRKTGGPSPRVGKPGGVVVHGGPRIGAQPGLTGALAGQRHIAPKLIVRAPMA